MSEGMSADCRRRQEELWSAWPEAGAVPEEARRHASGCAACGAELAALESWGRPARWSDLIPEARRARLAVATTAGLGASAPPPGRGPLAPGRGARAPWVWAPALALAGFAALFLWTHPAPETIPLAAAENLELLENLDLLQDWDLLSDEPPAQAPR